MCVILCQIWYHLHNLKKPEKHLRRDATFSKVAFTKINTPPSTRNNSHKASHMLNPILFSSNIYWFGTKKENNIATYFKT